MKKVSLIIFTFLLCLVNISACEFHDIFEELLPGETVIHEISYDYKSPIDIELIDQIFVTVTNNYVLITNSYSTGLYNYTNIINISQSNLNESDVFIVFDDESSITIDTINQFENDDNMYYLDDTKGMILKEQYEYLESEHDYKYDAKDDYHDSTNIFIYVGIFSICLLLVFVIMFNKKSFMNKPTDN